MLLIAIRRLLLFPFAGIGSHVRSARQHNSLMQGNNQRRSDPIPFLFAAVSLDRNPSGLRDTPRRQHHLVFSRSCSLLHGGSSYHSL